MILRLWTQHTKNDANTALTPVLAYCFALCAIKD